VRRAALFAIPRLLPAHGALLSCLSAILPGAGAPTLHSLLCCGLLRKRVLLLFFLGTCYSKDLCFSLFPHSAPPFSCISQTRAPLPSFLLGGRYHLSAGVVVTLSGIYSHISCLSPAWRTGRVRALRCAFSRAGLPHKRRWEGTTPSTMHCSGRSSVSWRDGFIAIYGVNGCSENRLDTATTAPVTLLPLPPVWRPLRGHRACRSWARRHNDSWRLAVVVASLPAGRCALLG